MDAPNYLRTAERKKVLSNIESLGLLSAAEKAGLSLSKVNPRTILTLHEAAFCTKVSGCHVHDVWTSCIFRQVTRQMPCAPEAVKKHAQGPPSICA